MCKGFMRISRERISDFEWLDNPTVCYFFLRLLLKANYKDGRWQGVEVKRGQLLAGRKSLGEEFSLTERQVRTCLDKLTSTGYIVQQTTNRYTIITICNYESWQNDAEQNVQQDVTQTPNKCPTNDQQTTTIEISKEIEELKKENNRLKEELTKVSKKKKEDVDADELTQTFEKFRLRYKECGGKARGLETELDNLKKKHKDWKEIIPLLLGAIEKENAERQNAKATGKFFAEIKNLQTYINNRSWEAYVSGDNGFEDDEYKPISDNIFQRWNPARKCLEVNSPYLNMLNDGYNEDNRPDGARVACQQYMWRWSKEKKDWIQE